MPTVYHRRVQIPFLFIRHQRTATCTCDPGDDVAKIWLESFDVEYNHGYNKPELNKIVKLTRENKVRLLEVWNDYFSQ